MLAAQVAYNPNTFQAQVAELKFFMGTGAWNLAEPVTNCFVIYFK